MKRLTLCVLFLALLLFSACAGPTGSAPTQDAATSTTATTATTAPALSAQQIAEKLKAAGLPISEIFAFTAENDPNHLLGRPGQYTSKVAWRDSRVPLQTSEWQHEVSDGGGIEVCATLEEATRRFTSVEEISQSSPLFAEYDYQAGQAILRISKVLTPAQAEAYHKAFQQIVAP